MHTKNTQNDKELELDDCLEILQSYKNEIDFRALDRIDSTIKNMYLSYCTLKATDVIMLIDIAKGRLSYKEASEQTKERIIVKAQNTGSQGAKADASNNKDLIKSNLLGLKDIEAISEAENSLSVIAIDALAIRPIQGDFDFKHLKKIHKAIFKDIYKWAGKDRGEMKLYGSMAKGGRHGTLAFCQGAYIESNASSIFSKLARANYFKNTSMEEFAARVANFLGDLYALHPFREGNSRTQRIFINALAKNAGFTLNLNKIKESVTKEVMELALAGDTEELERVMLENMEELESLNQN